MFVTLPIELQQEMADYYLQNEKDIPNEIFLLLHSVMNHETAVSSDERELLRFLEAIMRSVYSIHDCKLILQYMKDYSANAELESVLEVRIG